MVQSGTGSCPYAYQAVPDNPAVIGQVVTRYGAKSPNGVAFTIHPRAIPAGDRLAIVFPRRGGDVPKAVPASPVPYVPGAGPSPVASSSGVPGATPSPVGPGRPAPHPVAIRLIPAIAPACAAPSAVPSTVPSTAPSAVPSPR